jgi:hypothetical protein
MYSRSNITSLCCTAFCPLRSGAKSSNYSNSESPPPLHCYHLLKVLHWTTILQVVHAQLIVPRPHKVCTLTSLPSSVLFHSRSMRTYADEFPMNFGGEIHTPVRKHPGGRSWLQSIVVLKVCLLGPTLWLAPLSTSREASNLWATCSTARAPIPVPAPKRRPALFRHKPGRIPQLEAKAIVRYFGDKERASGPVVVA